MPQCTDHTNFLLFPFCPGQRARPSLGQFVEGGKTGKKEADISAVKSGFSIKRLKSSMPETKLVRQAPPLLPSPKLASAKHFKTSLSIPQICPRMIPCPGKSIFATGFPLDTGCVCSQGPRLLFQLCFPGQDGGRRGPPTSLPQEVRQPVRVTTPLGLAGETEAESALPCLG